MSEAGETAKIGRDTALRHAPQVLERRTRVSVVVLADQFPVVLRGSGTAIWDAFAAPRSLADAVAELADAYGAPPDVVEREMVPVLEELQRAHALTTVTRSEAADAGP